MADGRPGQAVAAMKAAAPALPVDSMASTFVNGQTIDWQGWEHPKATT